MTKAVKRRVILDCDPGIGPGLDADDVLAILFLVASPELTLEGVTTTYGNVDAPRAAANAVRTLAAAGRPDVPVCMGMSVPLTGRLHARAMEEYESLRQRLGPVDEQPKGKHALHSSDFIIAKVMENPGEIDVVAVGPLTNLALAIIKEPALKKNIRRVTILGGAFGREPTFGRGNITPVAEYNIWGDPLAADIVFTSGIPMTAVGLDVCNPVRGTVLYRTQLEPLLTANTPFVKFLREVTETYIKQPKFNWVKDGCVLYDILATATLVDPALVKTEVSKVRVEHFSDLTWGQTVATPAEGGHVAVAIDANGPAFVDLFLKRIKSLVDQSIAAVG